MLFASVGVSSGLTCRFFKKFMPKSGRKDWKVGPIFLFLPFVVAYSVILAFLTFMEFQESLYYSLIWYSSLGVGLLLFGLFSESKDEWLVTNTSTHVGISMIQSSLAFIPLANLVIGYYGVMALQLVASSIMLLIYLGAFLFIFRSMTEGDLVKGNWDMGELEHASLKARKYRIH